MPHLAGLADTVSFADEAPLSEQVRLHVKHIKAVHPAGGVDAMEHDGRHIVDTCNMSL